LNLSTRTHWIFDLDGTLTRAVHDFDAIRAELDLPHGVPILETLDALPQSEAAPRYRRLDEIELELAARSVPQAGATVLLDALRQRGACLGVLTRNSERIAHATLERCGLLEFFEPQCVVGRESAAPKPSPEGIHRLLARWEAAPQTAVMVGDFQFDLLAGRRAGVATVYLDTARRGEWRGDADHSVHDLAELLALATDGHAHEAAGSNHAR
jgi:HAD superfamily hydrolase (TIGR01509 family)